jgi:outer membrane protein assembly factor BamB
MGRKPSTTTTAKASPPLSLEETWQVNLPAAPAADPTADQLRVYVPLSNGTVVALSRETGDLVWSSPISTRWPLARTGSSVLLATGTTLQQLDAETGRPQGAIDLTAPPAHQIATRGDLAIVPLESGTVVAVRDGKVIWSRDAGAAAAAPPGFGSEAVYVATTDARVCALSLYTGELLWTSEVLEGTLVQPVASSARVVVGSSERAVFALNASTGRLGWRVVTGGAVVGTTIAGGSVYIVSLDNVVRAVSESTGNQQWKLVTTTRALTAPQLDQTRLLLHGNGPVLRAVDFATGEARGSFELPEELAPILVQGAPIVLPQSEGAKTSVVIILRNGSVLGAGPAAAKPASYPFGSVVN